MHWSIPLHHWWQVKLSARNRAKGPVTPGVKDLRLRMIQQWYMNDANDISMMSQWDTAESLDVAETVVHLGMRDFRQHLRGWSQGFPGRGVFIAKRHPKKKERKVYDRNVIYVVSYDFTILVGGCYKLVFTVLWGNLPLRCQQSQERLLGAIAKLGPGSKSQPQIIWTLVDEWMVAGIYWHISLVIQW